MEQKLDKEVIKELKEADKIFKELDKFFEKEIREGKKIIELVEYAEKKIKEKFGLAFPINVSINNIAAHDTAQWKDRRTIKDGDVVKIDVGVYVKGGYIIDSAKTYIAGENEKGEEIKRVNEKALKEAVNEIEIGISIEDIGKKIYEIVKENGLGIVKNLTGHELLPYKIHGSFSIPNFPTKNKMKIEEEMSVAIEPFVCSLSKDIIVKDHPRVEIYEIIDTGKNLRGKILQEIGNFVKNNFFTFPFAKRWIIEKYNTSLANLFLTHAFSNKIICQYPVLYYPKENVLISQCESTIYIYEGKKYVFGFF